MNRTTHATRSAATNVALLSRDGAVAYMPSAASGVEFGSSLQLVAELA